MKREDRVEQLLARDRELMARLKDATPDQMPDLLRQRKQVKSQMNLYGPAATARWMKQEFVEFADEVAKQDEVRKTRWAKNPALLEKISKLAAGQWEI